MPMRSPAGFISAFFDPLKNPDAPTIGTATGGDSSAAVTFTAPSNVGGSAITAYYAVSNPGQITTSGASSPITATGLTNGTAYTFNVWALNTYGPGVWSAASNSATPFAPSIGLIAGGSGGTNIINKMVVETLGNATSYGNLTNTSRAGLMSCGSTTNAFYANETATNITTAVFASTGTATNIGSLSVARSYGAGCNSATRGVFCGGYQSVTGYNTIDYITMSSAGSASSFGQITSNATGGRYGTSGLSNSTRGIFSGGTRRGGGTYFASADYITIASTGNTTSFGSANAYSGVGGVSNSTRGLFISGGDDIDNYSSIQYVTIATTGSTASFGNLNATVPYMIGNNAVSNSTRAVMWGNPSSAQSNYVTIATTGNGVNFGTLTVTTYWAGASSSANGGVQ